MGLLDFISTAAPIAANAVGNYEHAQAQGTQQKNQAIVQALQIKRQQEEDALKRAIADRQATSASVEDALRKTQMQKLQYDLDHPKPQAIDPLSPAGIQAKQGLIDYERTHGYHAPSYNPMEVHAANREFDAAHPVAAKGAGASGTGHGSALDKRSKSYVDLMVHALPTMQGKADKVRPEAISFALAHPTVGNYLLNDDEQQYLQASRDFLAGVLHQESGARLTDSQVAFGMQRYVPLAGDSKEVRAQKLAAAQQVMQERQADYAGVGGQPAPAPAPAMAPREEGITEDQRDWDAAVAKYGQARVLKEYGPRP